MNQTNEYLEPPKACLDFAQLSFNDDDHVRLYDINDLSRFDLFSVNIDFIGVELRNRLL